MEEHAVFVHFDYEAASLVQLSDLEKQLESAVIAAGVGVFDGSQIEVDPCHGTLEMRGQDADALFAFVRPLLASSSWLHNVHVQLRYGLPEVGVRQRVVALVAEPKVAPDCGGIT